MVQTYIKDEFITFNFHQGLPPKNNVLIRTGINRHPLPSDESNGIAAKIVGKDFKLT